MATKSFSCDWKGNYDGRFLNEITCAHRYRGIYSIKSKRVGGCDFKFIFHELYGIVKYGFKLWSN